MKTSFHKSGACLGQCINPFSITEPEGRRNVKIGGPAGAFCFWVKLSLSFSGALALRSQVQKFLSLLFYYRRPGCTYSVLNVIAFWTTRWYTGLNTRGFENYPINQNKLSLYPITKYCLLYELAFWICAHVMETIHSSFFLFSGKIFRDKWKWQRLRGSKSKILHVMFTYDYNAVIIRAMFGEFFYYFQHTEKLIKSWV